MKKKEVSKKAKEYKQIRKKIKNAGKQEKQITRLLKKHAGVLKAINSEFKPWAQKFDEVNQNDLSSKISETAKMLADLQVSYNLQYVQLQNHLQNENQVFSSVSNVLKTRHDTAKNSISNIR